MVAFRAGARCEYCRMHQSLQGATFHIEHVRPLRLGGTNDFENLALACPSCNLQKSDRVAIDLKGGEEPVPLFNPRDSEWSEHFEWDDYDIRAKTEIGNATIIALDLNHYRRIKIRQAEQLFRLFPPDPS